MEGHQTHSDYDLGRKICRELRSGNRSAILAVYNRYQQFFTAFAQKRLFNKEQEGVEDVLSSFWLELLNGNAICSYNGVASLRTYLTVMLNRRIIDANRKFERNRSSISLLKEKANGSDESTHDRQTPEQTLLERERRNLIHKALVRLSDISPRDANLIRMNLEGLSYEQMAKRELNGEKADQAELKRKVDAVKKQFTRKETGSMARFRSVLNRHLDTAGLSYSDFLDQG